MISTGSILVDSTRRTQRHPRYWVFAAIVGVRALGLSNLAWATGPWSRRSPVVGKVTGIAVSPHQPNIVLACVDSSGLFSSQDEGASWHQPFENIGAQAIVFDPGSLGTVYAGSVDNISKSVDFGQTWQTVYLPDWITSLAVDPRNGAHLLAGSASGVVYSSADAGAAWGVVFHQPASLNLQATFLRFDSSTSGVAYAGFTGAGIWKSADEGKSWFPLNEGLPSTVSALSFDASGSGSGSVFFLGTDQGLFESFNAGSHWAPVIGMIPTLPVRAVKVSAASPGDVFAGTDQGVFESVDEGDTWARAEVLSNLSVVALESAPSGRIYAGTENGGVFIRSPGGSWGPSSRGLFGGGCWRVFFDPSSDSGMFAFCDRLYASDDRGSTWLPTGVAPPDSTFIVAFTEGAFFATGSSYATSQAELEVTKDRGQSWSPVSFPASPYSYIIDLQRDPSNPQGLFLLMSDALLRSTDLGETWVSIGPQSTKLQPLNFNLSSVLIDPHTSSVIHLSDSYLGMMKTTDGGVSWYAANTGFPQVTDWSSMLAGIGNDPSVVYATFTTSTGCPSSASSVASSTGEDDDIPAFFFRSEDAGETWVPMGTPPGDTFGFTLAVDPKNASHVFGGSIGNCDLGAGDAFESLDGGLTWIQVEQKLPRTHIFQLLVSSDGSRLYAATASGILQAAIVPAAHPITTVSADPVAPIHRRP